MVLELLTNVTIQKGLGILGETAPSMSDILTARVKTPTLEDGTDLWGEVLDSKDVNFYGSKNEDNRYRFKVDHKFDLKKIVDATLVNGAVPSNNNDYSASTGAEFIILDGNHAIRADKYKSIADKLKQDDYSIDALQDGIFIINEDLTPDQVIKYDKSKKIEDLTWEDIKYVHDGWLEHAVGKNSASKEECLEAAKLLASYVLEAEKRGCFDGTGFYVNTTEDLVVRPWCFDYSDNDSDAYGRYDFSDFGRFLRVQNIAAESGQQNISYDHALEVVLGNPIRTDAEASAISRKLTEYLQAKQ